MVEPYSESVYLHWGFNVHYLDAFRLNERGLKDASSRGDDHDVGRFVGWL